jgi:hypothetical protein
MKSRFTSVAFGLFLATALFVPRAHAQLVVDAPTADAELVTADAALATDVVEDTKTATTVTEALGVAKNTLTAIGSGVTTFGDLAFQADDSLPADAAGTLDLMSSTGAASDIARTVQKASSSLDQPFFSKVIPFAKSMLSNDMDSAASSTAANEDIYLNAKAHTVVLEKLRAQIATTVDLKETEDLAARIQLENADITNEMVKAQALQNMENNNDKVRTLQTKQQMFGRNSRTY